MREIKFRAKKICDGEWEYGGYYKDGGDHYIVNELGEHWEVDRATLGQYIGLTAEYNAGIYEGDIWEEGSTTWQIVWSCLDAGLVLIGSIENKYRGEIYKEPVSLPLSELFRDDDFTLVGNIHDNSELLEVS